MGHTTGIIFRTTAPGRVGKGSNLTPEEVDDNFQDVDERVDTLETTPPVPIEITSITVVGASMTVNMADGGSFGPFTLPTAEFNWRDTWAPLTSYFEMDVFFAPGDGVYLVITDFESATAFDPLAVEITKMLPDTTVNTLDDVGDVDYPTGGPAEGDVLVYRGTTGIWTPESGISKQTAAVQTTDATQTVLASGAMAAGSAHTIRAYGHGREDATGDTYHFEIFAGARNEGGTSSAPTPNVIEVADAGAAAWDATLEANDTSDEWEIKVTGEAAHTIDWTVTYFEIVKP